MSTKDESLFELRVLLMLASSTCMRTSLFTNDGVILYKRHEYLLELHMAEEKPDVRMFPARDGCLVPRPLAAGLDAVVSRLLIRCSP